MDDSTATPPAAMPPTDASRASSSSWKRFLWIGLPLVLALGVGLYLWWPSLQHSILINGLNSDNPKVVKEMIDKLTEHPDAAAVNERLKQALHNDSRSFEVRLTCGKLLLQRNRRTQLEDALKNGAPRAQEVALKALSTQSTFVNYYVKDDRWQAQKIIANWLAREDDMSRTHAVGLARKIDMNEAMPVIRPLLTASNNPATDRKLESRLMETAIEAVRQFQDCESVPQLKALAESSPYVVVRMRALQNLFRMMSMDEVCADAIDASEVRRINAEALASNQHMLRLAALIHYRRMPEWTRDDKANILSIVTDSTRDSEERRHALEVMAGSGDTSFLDDFATYFFDKESTVRSSAVQAAHQFLAKNRFQGCFIAIIRNEAKSEVAFREALRGLQLTARKLVGFDDSTMKLASTDPRKLDAIILEIFKNGSSGSTSRLAVANAWFDWWTEHKGLSKAGEAAIAQTAHRKFWKAADAKNVAEARAALQEAKEQLGKVPEHLYAAEEAWLRMHADS